MPTVTLERAEHVLVGWLTEAEPDSPAGPLFPSSEYAAAEITMTGSPGTRCSSCTASARVFCC